MRIADILTMTLLGANAWQDLRKQEILLFPTVLGAALGIVYKCLEGGTDAAGMLAALLPGGILLLLSFALGQKIGTGDALAVLEVGAWEEAETTWMILLAGFFAAAAGAGIFFLFRKKKKEIPFVPFLFLGAAAVLVLREAGL